MSKPEPIAIVGGGAWGLSTALHLHRAGYTNITVFETADSIPSRYSAAYDINKIVRAEYEESFYTDLALVSLVEEPLERTEQLTFFSASDRSMERSSFRPVLSRNRVHRSDFRVRSCESKEEFGYSACICFSTSSFCSWHPSVGECR